MLLFMDGQAHYATEDLPLKYNRVATGYAVLSVVPEGRSGNCIKRVSTSNDVTSDALAHLAISPLMTRTGLWTPTTSGVCGFALKVNDVGRCRQAFRGTNPIDLFVVVENNQAHVKVSISQDGTFLLRGCAATMIGAEILLAQTAEGIQSNVWNFLEFKWFIDTTAGTFQLRVNGVEILNFTGNTNMQQESLWNPTSMGIWTAVHVLGQASSPPPYLTLWMEDLYLADLTGGAGDVKDFLGDGTIATIFPDGPGLAAGWTPNPDAPGIANWDQVNDKPAPDGDTTYVVTTAPGTRDCHTFENIPGGSTVFGAHYNLLLRKESEGTVLIKPVVGQGGVQYDGPEQGVGAITYGRYLTVPYDVNPATGAPWTAAEINAGQWGIVKTA
jgi:hypothetical protein